MGAAAARPVVSAGQRGMLPAEVIMKILEYMGQKGYRAHCGAIDAARDRQDGRLVSRLFSEEGERSDKGVLLWAVRHGCLFGYVNHRLERLVGYGFDESLCEDVMTEIERQLDARPNSGHLANISVTLGQMSYLFASYLAEHPVGFVIEGCVRKVRARMKEMGITPARVPKFYYDQLCEEGRGERAEMMARINGIDHEATREKYWGGSEWE